MMSVDGVLLEHHYRVKLSTLISPGLTKRSLFETEPGSAQFPRENRLVTTSPRRTSSCLARHLKCRGTLQPTFAISALDQTNVRHHFQLAPEIGEFRQVEIGRVELRERHQFGDRFNSGSQWIFQRFLGEIG